MLWLGNTQRTVLTLGLTLALAATTGAQTTGVAGYNDFTIGGSFPGSASCQFMLIPASTLTPFNVSTAPGAPVALLLNLNCPCQQCFFTFGPTTASCAIPPTACSATTNQAFELNSTLIGCVLIAVAMPTANSAGNSNLVIPMPVTPPPVRFSAQCVALHPCNATSPFPPVFTQAYDVLVP